MSSSSGGTVVRETQLRNRPYFSKQNDSFRQLNEATLRVGQFEDLKSPVWPSGCSGTYKEGSLLKYIQ